MKPSARRQAVGSVQASFSWSERRACRALEMDFVSDVTESGRRFRVFAVVDDFSRRCVALVADTSFSGARLAKHHSRFDQQGSHG